MPATKAEARVYVATDDFVVMGDDGAPQFFKRGQTRVRDGHAVLKGREHMFRLSDEVVQYDVESATAAPGERRGAKEE